MSIFASKPSSLQSQPFLVLTRILSSQDAFLRQIRSRQIIWKQHKLYFMRNLLTFRLDQHAVVVPELALDLLLNSSSHCLSKRRRKVWKKL